MSTKTKLNSIIYEIESIQAEHDSNMDAVRRAIIMINNNKLEDAERILEEILKHQ